jgi:hypothetical protein
VKKSELITYRTAKPEDIAFIFSTWLRGLRYGNKAFEAIPSRLYYTEMHKAVEEVLRNTLINVACLKNDPDTVLGYSVTSPKILHWVFVKKAWRGVGIGRDLIPNDVVLLTSSTESVKKFIKESNVRVQQLCPSSLVSYLEK